MKPLALCTDCQKKNRHLAGFAVYVRRGGYTPRGSKSARVLALKAAGVPNTTIARRVKISLRQVYRIVGVPGGQ